MTILNRSRSVLLAFATAALLACGGGSAADSEPHDSQTTTGGDEGTDSSGEDTSGATSPSESCYVVSVDGQEGCWDEADTACNEVCGAPCTCTEATVNNTCGC